VSGFIFRTTRFRDPPGRMLHIAATDEQMRGAELVIKVDTTGLIFKADIHAHASVGWSERIERWLSRRFGGAT
jgi:hypothetical protein